MTVHSFTLRRPSLSVLSFMLIATPKQTSALEKTSVSRTSNPCFRLISNYSFSEFRLSCQTASYSPGISSAASKPTVQKGPRLLLFTLIFSDFKTNFMKIEVAYFRGKLSKGVYKPKLQLFCHLCSNAGLQAGAQGQHRPKPQRYLLHTHFTVPAKCNSAVSQPNYPLYYDGINYCENVPPYYNVLSIWP